MKSKKMYIYLHPEGKNPLGILTDVVDPDDPENDPAIKIILSAINRKYEDLEIIEHEGRTYFFDK